MTEINQIYELVRPIKSWPVKDAQTIDEAAKMVFGSPYWDMPQDRYIVIDKNNTYSLLAVYQDEKAKLKIEYMAVNMDLVENSKRILK